MTGPANSAEQPWPVRTVNTRIAEWVHRLGAIWVDGQLTQINRRGRMTYMVLRDPAAEVSIAITCESAVVDRAEVSLTEGSRVLVHGRPSFYTGRAQLSLRVTEIRAVGIGELLARINRLGQLLRAEGLFDPRLKRPLPFLPNTVGLITGRNGAAQHDVVSVATARWEQVRFEVRNVAVQGQLAVPQILAELAALDADPHVDVIILARGGGSVEDLLPFSDETLCRAVAAVTTPVVSAIGHEPDSPLLDHVADVRAATPTDAAKKVVPDVPAERALITALRDRNDAALRNWVTSAAHQLSALRSRPVLADPLRRIDDLTAAVERDRRTLRRDTVRLIDRHIAAVEHDRKQLRNLGPAQTLRRGYAVVQRGGPDTSVLRHVADLSDAEVHAGAALRIRLADGAIGATVVDVERADPGDAP